MRVAIVGAGIAGLTTALSFARIGWTVSVFERVEQIKPLGAGIQLSPNAMHVMRYLGLEHAINSVASAPRAIEIRDAVSGRSLTSVPLGMTIERRFGAPYLSIHRGDLQRIMLDEVRGDGRIALETGRAIGPRDPELDSYDLAVLASGIRTEQDEVDESQAELTAWRTLVASSDLPDTIKGSSTSVWLAPGAHLVHYPVRSGLETNLVLVLRNGGERPEDYGSASKGWGEDAAAIVRLSNEWQSWPITERIVREPWFDGKRVRIGDAAHSIWPFAAQGGAMAIEDGWTLAASLVEGFSTDALHEWESARRSRRAQVAAISRRNRSIYHAKGPIRVARNVVMRTVPPEMLMRGVNGIYGWTPKDGMTPVLQES